MSHFLCMLGAGALALTCLPAHSGTAASAAASAPAVSAAASVARGASAAASASAPAAASSAPYSVVNGTQVDAQTLAGFRAWRAASCDRCHGSHQEGGVGPSLIESLKTLSKAEFITTVTKGRVEKGMPNWDGNKMVMGALDGLYGYLKGRSDGAITDPRVTAKQ